MYLSWSCVTLSLGCYVIVIKRCHNASLAGHWYIYQVFIHSSHTAGSPSSKLIIIIIHILFQFSLWLFCGARGPGVVFQSHHYVILIERT